MSHEKERKDLLSRLRREGQEDLTMLYPQSLWDGNEGTFETETGAKLSWKIEIEDHSSIFIEDEDGNFHEEVYGVESESGDLECLSSGECDFEEEWGEKWEIDLGEELANLEKKGAPDREDPDSWVRGQPSFLVLRHDGCDWSPEDGQVLDLEEAVKMWDPESQLVISREIHDGFRWESEIKVLYAPDFREQVLRLFPSIPTSDLEPLLSGRNEKNPSVERVVEAYIRHNLTDYEETISAATETRDNGEGKADDSAKREVRRAVRSEIDRVLEEWSKPSEK